MYFGLLMGAAKGCGYCPWSTV